MDVKNIMEESGDSEEFDNWTFVDTEEAVEATTLNSEETESDSRDVSSENAVEDLENEEKSITSETEEERIDANLQTNADFTLISDSDDGVSIITDSELEELLPPQSKHEADANCHNRRPSQLSNDYFDQSDIPSDAPEDLGQRGDRKYVHKPNQKLNLLLNVLITICIAAVLGLGVGHFVGLQEECGLTHQSELLDTSVFETTNLLNKLESENEHLKKQLLQLQQDLKSKQLYVASIDSAVLENKIYGSSEEIKKNQYKTNELKPCECHATNQDLEIVVPITNSLLDTSEESEAKQSLINTDTQNNLQNKLDTTSTAPSKNTEALPHLNKDPQSLLLLANEQSNYVAEPVKDFDDSNDKVLASLSYAFVANTNTESVKVNKQSENLEEHKDIFKDSNDYIATDNAGDTNYYAPPENIAETIPIKGENQQEEENEASSDSFFLQMEQELNDALQRVSDLSSKFKCQDLKDHFSQSMASLSNTMQDMKHTVKHLGESAVKHSAYAIEKVKKSVQKMVQKAKQSSESLLKRRQTDESFSNKFLKGFNNVKEGFLNNWNNVKGKLSQHFNKKTKSNGQKKADSSKKTLPRHHDARKTKDEPIVKQVKTVNQKQKKPKYVDSKKFYINEGGQKDFKKRKHYSPEQNDTEYKINKHFHDNGKKYKSNNIKNKQFKIVVQKKNRHCFKGSECNATDTNWIEHRYEGRAKQRSRNQESEWLFKRAKGRQNSRFDWKKYENPNGYEKLSKLDRQYRESIINKGKAWNF